MPPVSARARQRIVRSLLGTAVGIVFLVLVWRALGRSVAWRGVDLQAGAIALALTGALGFLVARAWRYHLLLPRHRAGAGKILGVTAISWAVGLLVPGPSADASFIGLARSRMGVSAARATGVSLLGRVLDVMSLSVVAVVAAGLSSADEPVGAVLGAALAGAAAAVVFVTTFMTGPRQAVLRVAARIPRVARWVERTERAMSDLSDRPRAALLFASTALGRLSTAIEYMALFSLIDLHLDFWQVWFALAIRSFLTAIPIQGIAGIGTSQAWWTAALVLEGVAAGPAVAASVTLQVLDLIVALSLSAVVAIATLPAWRKRAPGGEDAEPEPELVAVAATRSYPVRVSSR